MIVEPPEKQHPAIRKMNLSILKLEEATTEAMSAFFADKENKTNAKKKPYLDEIFKVAKMEERYKNGEVGKRKLCHTDGLAANKFQMGMLRFSSCRRINSQRTIPRTTKTTAL